MNCEDEKCSDEYSDKNCNCYATYGTNEPLTDQLCAWRDGNFLFKCDPTCCNEGKGCPGECFGIKPQKPTKMSSVKPVIITKDDENKQLFDVKEVLILILIYLFVLRIIYT